MDRATRNELVRHIEQYGNLRANVAAYSRRYVDATKSDDPDKDIKSAEMLRKTRDANKEAESVMSDILLMLDLHTEKP